MRLRTSTLATAATAVTVAYDGTLPEPARAATLAAAFVEALPPVPAVSANEEPAT
jgi:hypothetical protein